MLLLLNWQNDKRILTIPPKANMALYWSKVWLKMQRKGITPATKNLLLVCSIAAAPKRMTYRTDSQERIDKMILLWKTVFAPDIHLYFSKIYIIFQDIRSICQIYY